jgi:hypothetical protein
MINDKTLNTKKKNLKNAQYELEEIKHSMGVLDNQKKESKGLIAYYSFAYFIASLSIITLILYGAKRFNYISPNIFKIYLFFVGFMVSIKYDIMLSLLFLLISIYFLIK